MMFSKIAISAALAMTAAALPQAVPSATTSSASTSSSASASASASPSSSAGGGVHIINNLGSTVYLWSTSSTSGNMQTLTAGGGTYSENWQTNPNGGGISIKMATTDSEDSVLQFEYTDDGDNLYWDLSSINLDSTSDFIQSGFSALPSDSSCKSASCQAGDTNCAASYQHPDDNDTNSCSSSAGLTVTLG